MLRCCVTVVSHQVLEEEVAQSEARCMGVQAALEKETHGRVAAEAELAMAKRELMKMPSECDVFTHAQAAVVASTVRAHTFVPVALMHRRHAAAGAV